MGQTTAYKKSVAGTVGAGMKSVFGGNGRRYYILEHKISSKYHRAGESQKIIVDQIELGRDSQCTVRFDESFTTVSRRHAAIIRDGDNWKLVQLSKTNSTYLNGSKVQTEWYLQNGDEIQLSTNGPKLGFIVPQGDKSLVKSIGLTNRLSLFRQQALKPYKKALAVLSCVLILAIAGSVFWITHLSNELDKALAKVENAIKNNKELSGTIEDLKKQDSITQSQIKKNRGGYGGIAVPGNLQNLVASVQPSVYFIVTTVYFQVEGEEAKKLSSSSGTGFLLDDGRFITARHCVEPWLFPPSEPSIAAETYPSECKIWSVIHAYGPTSADDFTLRSSDFRIDRSKDVVKDYATGENGETLRLRIASIITLNNGETLGNKESGGTDWAYAHTNKKGKISANASLSANLKAGTEVYVLGFPAGLGVNDSKTKRIEPIFNKMSVARSGLNDENCIMVSQGVAHGNSGGPVFVVSGGKIQAIAIVSRLEGRTQQYGSNGAIIQQQQQYDQLVPINNLK